MHYKQSHFGHHPTSALSILGPADVSAAYAQLEDGKSYKSASQVVKVRVRCLPCGELIEMRKLRDHLRRRQVKALLSFWREN